jgi:hypothetical protein
VTEAIMSMDGRYFAGSQEGGANKRVEKKMLSEINIEKLPSYQIGIEQGIERSTLKNVLNGIKKGFSDEIISAITSMSIADIKKLRLSK